MTDRERTEILCRLDQMACNTDLFLVDRNAARNAAAELRRLSATGAGPRDLQRENDILRDMSEHATGSASPIVHGCGDEPMTDRDIEGLIAELTAFANSHWLDQQGSHPALVRRAAAELRRLSATGAGPTDAGYRSDEPAAASRPTIKCSRCNGAGVLIVDDPASNHMVCSKPCERCAGIGRIAVDVMNVGRPSLAAQAEVVERALESVQIYRPSWIADAVWNDDMTTYRAALTAAARTLRALPGVVEAVNSLADSATAAILVLLGAHYNGTAGALDRQATAVRAALRRLGGEKPG